MTFDVQRVAASVGVAAFLCTPGLRAAQVGAQHVDLQAEIVALREEQARIAELQRAIETRLRELEARSSSAAAFSRVVVPTSRAAVETGSRLSVIGDMRLRYQGDYSDDDAPDRSSSQVRARLGATYAVNDRVTLGARFVTGDPDDPNGTDVQLSSFDDDLQFSLDLAYAQLNLRDVTIYAGKIPQPFARTDLVWDGDVNPQGISAVYKRSFAGGSAFRANSLFFVVDENAVAADSTMVGAQIGYDSAALGHWKIDASVAYYDYRLGSVAGGDAGDFRSNLRNLDGSYRSDFDLTDVLVGVTWTGAGGRWPARFVADYVYNGGANTSADTGYGMDLSVGRASMPGDWRVTYGYSVAETDAVLAAFSHDNIGIGTNYKLHAVTFDYVPWPKTLISGIWYHYSPAQALDAGSNAPGDWLDRLRVAFLVNF